MADVPKNYLAQIKEFEDLFTVDTAKLKEVVEHFVKELEKGELNFYSGSFLCIFLFSWRWCAIIHTHTCSSLTDFFRSCDI